MSKLYFSYASMNAGKSTSLLQVAHNYAERGMAPYLLTAALDTRDGKKKISSRIGVAKESETYAPKENLYEKIKKQHDLQHIDCILVDEAQWLQAIQVQQLARVVDSLGVPVMCYGLRTDFQGKLFTGSQELLAIADELREIRTICHCGKKATMVLRRDNEGRVVSDGPQIQVGGNETYESVCRKHWSEAIKRT
jgi:thymidine kinase